MKKKKESRVSERRAAYQISDKEKQIVKKWFPVLLKQDMEFGSEVMGHLTGVLATKDDIAKILARIAKTDERIAIIEENIAKIYTIVDEHTKILVEQTKIVGEHTRVLGEHTKALEEHSRILQELIKAVHEHTRRLDSFDRTLSAIGARWGILSEESFRDGIRGIIENYGFKIEKWRVKDEDGIVFGKIAMIEADILIKDNIHTVIEIKSSVSAYDITGFKRIGELYEKLTNTKPKLVVISPYISESARILAAELQIETYSQPEEALELTRRENHLT
ncbi:MAG: DUF3782 domain-containing protein [Elusimicrobiota bacterium]|nr:DUF3782 domain-containing protein [Elusimicrobiota bacterium]